MGLRECYVNGVGLCYFHGFGTHVSGDTRAIVELKEGVTMTKEEMDEFCLALPRYKRPKEVIFADIPRNPTGKIEKPKLREMYGANRLIADQNMG